MQNSLFQAICRVGIFMICAQAIVHFRPREAYEKYLKLLVSIMVLIQLFLPIGGFFLGRGGEETARALEQFRRELEESMEQAEENAAEADEILERMTLEEVKKRLEAQQEELRGSGEQESLPEGETRYNDGGQESLPEGEIRQNGEGQDDPPEGEAQESRQGTERIDIETVEPIRIAPESSAATKNGDAG